MIYSFQGIRALVAIAVVVQHVTRLPGYMEQSNNFGISLLFLMSGFLLSEKRPDNARLFFFDKVARIAPLNVFCILLAVLLSLGDLPYILPRALVDLLMLQSWIPIRSVYYSCDPVAWFLSSILLCYGLFPLLSELRHSRPYLFTGMWFFAAVVYTALIGCSVHDSQKLEAFIYVAPYSRLFDFALGMIAGGVKLRTEYWKWRTQTFVLMLCGLAFFASVHIPEVLFLASWWYMPGALLLLSVSQDKGYLSAFLSAKPLVWLGNISFEIFMLHLPVLYASRIIVAKTGLTFGTWPMLVAVLCTSIPGAWLVSRYFEQPLTHRLRAIINK